VQRADEPRALSTGVVGGVEWKLFIRDVYEGPLYDVATDEPVEGSREIIWKILLSASDGTELHGSWWPRTCGLGVHLHGWNKRAIGALKRHLIALGERP
jgi:hypothetical protein